MTILSAPSWLYPSSVSAPPSPVCPASWVNPQPRRPGRSIRRPADRHPAAGVRLGAGLPCRQPGRQPAGSRLRTSAGHRWPIIDQIAKHYQLISPPSPASLPSSPRSPPATGPLPGSPSGRRYRCSRFRLTTSWNNFTATPRRRATLAVNIIPPDGCPALLLGLGQLLPQPLLGSLLAWTWPD